MVSNRFKKYRILDFWKNYSKFRRIKTQNRKTFISQIQKGKKKKYFTILKSNLVHELEKRRVVNKKIFCLKLFKKFLILKKWKLYTYISREKVIDTRK